MQNAKSPSPDPLAVKLAERLHIRYQPELTILFGSRARGDHKPDKSDIDILLILKKSTPDTKDSQIQTTTQEIASQLYKTAVKPHIVPVMLNIFLDDAQYLNTISTKALLEGVIITENQGLLHNTHKGPNPPPPKYDWIPYEERTKAAALDTAIMVGILHKHGLGPDIQEPPQHIRSNWIYGALTQNADLTDLAELGKYAQEATAHLTAAILETTGGSSQLITTKNSDNTDDYGLAALREAVVQERIEIPATHIPLDIYQDRNKLNNMQPYTLVKTAQTDSIILRSKATRLRRQRNALLKKLY